ncbi:MAG: flippase-like domain-containing protein [Candidatus Brocadiae bacterium]|nr:flippase-like domain-containing protein [Candidatus Brocadiia bacterium]
MVSSQPEKVASSNLKKALVFFIRLFITLGFFYYLFFHLIHFQDEIFLANGQKVQGFIERISDDGISLKTAGESLWLEKEKLQKSKEGMFSVKMGFVSVLKKLDVKLFLPFVLFFLLNAIIGALRFQWLLASQKVILGYSQSLKVTFMGLFFGNFLPGFTGGDLVKAYYISKESSGIAKSLIAVLIDRVIGLASLIVLVALILTLQWGKAEFYLASLLIFSCFFTMVLGLIFFFCCPKKWVYQKNNALFRILQTFYDYQEHKKVLFKCFSITFFIHISTNIAVYGFALALGIHTIPWYTYFVYVPIGFLLMALPISLAGWGVGEAAYSFMFTKVGLPPEQAVVLSILVKIGQMLISLIGGFVWLSLGMRKK